MDAAIHLSIAKNPKIQNESIEFIRSTGSAQLFYLLDVEGGGPIQGRSVVWTNMRLCFAWLDFFRLAGLPVGEAPAMAAAVVLGYLSEWSEDLVRGAMVIT
jgi:hypothetical protein